MLYKSYFWWEKSRILSTASGVYDTVSGTCHIVFDGKIMTGNDRVVSGFVHAITPKKVASLLAGKNSTLQHVDYNLSKSTKSWLYFWREKILLYRMSSTTCQHQQKVRILLAGKILNSTQVHYDFPESTQNWLFFGWKNIARIGYNFFTWR